MAKSKLKNSAHNSWRKLYPEYDNHEFVIALDDKDSGLVAYIAVHSTKLGFAHGGTRMKVYEHESLALRDALNLSRAMTYKSALAGLPYGGAKGVIALGGGPFNRDKILMAYAKKIEQLNGLFHTGTDVGLTDDDVRLMAKNTQFMLGVGTGDKAGYSTGKAAAQGTYYAIQASAKHKYGSSDLKGLTIAVKGLGKLGGDLVALLHQAGAKLTVADVDQKQVEATIKEFPDVRTVPSSSIHKQDVQVYAPCALGAEFTPKSVPELRCQIIAGGANNQLESEAIGDELYQRHILYAPDYIVNAGGLIFVSDELEPDGFHIERVKHRLQAISQTLEEVFRRSDQQKLPTHRVADMIGQERLNNA